MNGSKCCMLPSKLKEFISQVTNERPRGIIEDEEENDSFLSGGKLESKKRARKARGQITGERELCLKKMDF